MLGYSEDDIIEMMASINIANNIIQSYYNENKAFTNGLYKAYDFFDGLLAEGRI